jgi:hypothetical protein
MEGRVPKDQWDALERARPLRSGAIGGAGAAFIIVAMIMLTFMIVDNVLLDIFSQQVSTRCGS